MEEVVGGIYERPAITERRAIVGLMGGSLSDCEGEVVEIDGTLVCLPRNVN